jgi:hypothetical protein
LVQVRPPESQNPIWRWPSLVPIFGLASWAIWHIVTQSGELANYYHQRFRDPFSYPVVEVFLFVALIVLEVIGLDRWFCLGSKPQLWFKALVATLVLAPASFYELTSLLHAPPFQAPHGAFLILLNLLLAGYTALGIAGALLQRAWQRGDV